MGVERRCSFCGDLVDTKSTMVMRKVTGWERTRQRGGQLLMRKPHDEWAYYTCVEALRAGRAPKQGRLV